VKDKGVYVLLAVLVIAVGVFSAVIYSRKMVVREAPMIGSKFFANEDGWLFEEIRSVRRENFNSKLEKLKDM
jgi:hypothetical protein